MHNLRKTRAFTLIELIVVIVIIGILAAIAAVSYNAFIAGANKTATESSAVQVGKIIVGDSAFSQESLNNYTESGAISFDSDVIADVATIDSPNSSHVIFNPSNGDQFTLLGSDNGDTIDEETVEVCNSDFSYCVAASLPPAAGAALIWSDSSTITGSGNTGGNTGGNSGNTGGNTGGNSANVAAVVNPDGSITVSWTPATGLTAGDYEIYASYNGSSFPDPITATQIPFVTSTSIGAGEWAFDVLEVDGSSVGTATVTKGTVANNFDTVNVVPGGTLTGALGAEVLSSPAITWNGPTLAEGASYEVCVDGDCEAQSPGVTNGFGSVNYFPTSLPAGSYDDIEVRDTNGGDIVSTDYSWNAAPKPEMTDTTTALGNITAANQLGGPVLDETADVTYSFFTPGQSLGVVEFRVSGDRSGSAISGSTLDGTTLGVWTVVNQFSSGPGLRLGQVNGESGDVFTLEVRDTNGNIVSTTYTQL